jgi:hypothetical protein
MPPVLAAGRRFTADGRMDFQSPSRNNSNITTTRRVLIGCSVLNVKYLVAQLVRDIRWQLLQSDRELHSDCTGHE